MTKEAVEGDIGEEFELGHGELPNYEFQENCGGDHAREHERRKRPAKTDRETFREKLLKIEEKKLRFSKK